MSKKILREDGTPVEERAGALKPTIAPPRPEHQCLPQAVEFVTKFIRVTSRATNDTLYVAVSEILGFEASAETGIAQIVMKSGVAVQVHEGLEDLVSRVRCD